VSDTEDEFDGGFGDKTQGNFGEKTQGGFAGKPEDDFGGKTQSDFAGKTHHDLVDNASDDFKITSGITFAEAGGVTVSQGLGDASNKNLAEIAGASADAIRPLEGRFALCSKLGEGGMAEVFAARDSMLNREIAVKVLSNKADVGLARFVREAQVTAQLSHPNVVPVYGLEETDQGAPALTMKLIRGSTFADYIKQCSSAAGTSDYDHERHGQVGRIEHFLRVCDAISYSHSRGVIHRDLKPDNLMLGAYGEVYVMDWGIAHLLDEPEEESSLADLDEKLSSADISSDSVEMKTQVWIKFLWGFAIRFRT